MAQSFEEKPREALVLFGGDKGWHAEDWTASDDRVRGGKSQSYLHCTTETGRFYGHLDIKTLGGAGFASQRTTGEDRHWDLSKHAGIQLSVAKGDKKRYTIILKDTLLPPNPANGREQATVSWECDFELPSQAEPGDSEDRQVFIPWASLNPTYRGKLEKDAKPINLKTIKRFSIMMRSFFGTQEGDFFLKIHSIEAAAKAPPPSSAQIITPDMSYTANSPKNTRADRGNVGPRLRLVVFMAMTYFAYVLVFHVALPIWDSRSD